MESVWPGHRLRPNSCHPPTPSDQLAFRQSDLHESEGETFFSPSSVPAYRGITRRGISEIRPNQSVLANHEEEIRGLFAA
jgi:hypothetical protein